MEQQKVIIIGGFAGAGKTTISQILAKNLHYTLLSSDEITHVIKNELNLPFHQASPAGFQTLWELAKIQISLGNSCFIDANMCHDKSWKNVDALKKEFPLLNIHIFILESPLEVHKKRFIERTRNQKDPKKTRIGHI